MKTLKTTLAITSVLLFASCAGITDTQIPEEETFQTSDSPQVIHQELPEFIKSGDQPDVIDVRPRDRYRDRDKVEEED